MINAPNCLLKRWEIEDITCFLYTQCLCTSTSTLVSHYIFSGVLYFSGREAGIVMAFADSQLSYLESNILLLLPGLPVCPSHWEILWKKSWISGLYQNKCKRGSQINIVWRIIVLCFLNFKCLTLHLINIHNIFSSFTFCCYGEILAAD